MKKSGNIIVFVNLAFFIVISILNFFYQKNGFAFPLKCACSTGFVLMGLANVMYVFKMNGIDKRFCILILTGFICAMLGDIFIVYNFIAGAAIFALGHVFFLFSYQRLKKYRKEDVCISAILYIVVVGFLLFFPRLNFSSPVLKIVCLIYAFIICNMLGKALGNLLSLKNIYAAGIAIGSILFFFSDLMLCLSKFTDCSKITSHLCMGTYYPSLCVLAFSIYLYGKSEKQL